MKRLFRNWNVLRVIRLLSGAVFAAYGIYASDSLMIVLGGLLMLMAMVNWSCGRMMRPLVREQSIV